MQIDEHHVRERAYYIWEGEGRIHGRATQHWIRAESEVLAAHAPAETVTVAAAPQRVQAKKTAETKAKPAAKAAKPAAPKASKAAVSAGLAAKAKPARAPAPLH